MLTKMTVEAPYRFPSNGRITQRHLMECNRLEFIGGGVRGSVDALAFGGKQGQTGRAWSEGRGREGRAQSLVIGPSRAASDLIDRKKPPAGVSDLRALGQALPARRAGSSSDPLVPCSRHPSIW